MGVKMTKRELTQWLPFEPSCINILVSTPFTGMVTDTTKLEYYRREKCYILVSLKDDESIGTSKCSVCGEHIDLFDRYCSHCGSKVIGKKLADEV